MSQAADADRDGQVSAEEFGTMINVATAAQKRLGLPAPYQTTEEQGEPMFERTLRLSYILEQFNRNYC